MAELKVTPERIYHLEFHPTVDKPLIFAGDKVGNLGILDASGAGDKPDISTFQLHTRSISTFFIPPTAPESLYTSSYDTTVRRFDLNSGKSVELFVHPSEEGLSSVCALDDSCNNLIYSTLDGEVGMFDVRTENQKTDAWQCSDKKIGGLHVLPTDRNYFATASLDRTVKIWDLRNISAPIAEHTSRLSVSAAQWSRTGKLATTSYDNTIKIYNPKLTHGGIKKDDAGVLVKKEEEDVIAFVKKEEDDARVSVKSEESASDDQIVMEPEHIIPHNCQTGRW